MITRILTPNALEPASRSVRALVIDAPEVELRSLLPSDWGSPEHETLPFHNGMRAEDWSTPVQDGDVVLFVGGVTDPVSLILIGIAVVSAIVAVSLIEMPEIPQSANPSGSSTYGYYGFNNSYKAEGDPIPVVYGRIRMAPPCVNQVIAQSAVGGELLPSSAETLYALFALSEGPINGVGSLLGEVSSAADQAALLGTFGNAVVSGGLQINGIPAQNFISGLDWRTGTLTQEPLIGSAGYITYTDTASIYDIDLKPVLGTSGIDEASKPSGVYTPVSNSLIREDVGEYVSQNIDVKSDNCVVQILFDRGLYEQDGSGNWLGRSKTIRVQYRETDAGGTGIGDVVLLPEYALSSSQSDPLVFDIPFEFTAAADYSPATQQGYYAALNTTPRRLEITDPAGVALLASSQPNGLQDFTIGGWISAYDLRPSRRNPCIYSAWTGTPPSFETYVDFGVTYPRPRIDRTTVLPGAQGWSVHLWRDANDFYQNGADEVYIVAHFWHVTGGTSSPRTADWRSRPLGTFDQSWSGGDVGIGSEIWRHFTLRFNWEGSIQGGVPYYHLDGVTHTMIDVTGSQLTAGPRLVGLDNHNWGAFCGSTASANPTTGVGAEYYSEIALGEQFLYDGLFPVEDIQILGNPGVQVDQFGNKLVSVRSYAQDPKMLVALTCDNPEGSLYRNWAAHPSGAVAEASGDITITDLSGVQSTGAPVVSGGSGGGKSSYWNVEVFVSDQLSTTQLSDVATISSITALSSQPYSYPSTAIASVRIAANEQVNNQEPKVTLLVEGRRVQTWDGSALLGEAPSLVTEWTRNPAWIAADLLTNDRYGLGGDITTADIDWPSFREWGDYCEEGVPDAFGEMQVFGITAEGDSIHVGEQLVTLYIGLLDSSETFVQRLPETWLRPRFDFTTVVSVASVSLTSVLDGGISSEWVTANDLVTGLNEASNQLGIYRIEAYDNASGFHGYRNYVVVKLRWKRLNSSGVAVWPSGVTQGNTFFADDLGVAYLAKASGYEPRCCFDGVFDQKNQSGWKAILTVFAAGRAMPIKAGRKVYAVVDKPRDPVAVFGQANIVKDSLQLSYLGPKERPNSIESEILDSQANYERRTIQVDHPSIQDPALFDSFRKENVDLRGVVRRSQAVRDCTYRLNRYHLVRRTAMFEVGPDAVNLLPGDRIKLSHDVPQYGYSGRLRGDQATTNVLASEGSFYDLWGGSGGDCAVSAYSILYTTADARPTGFTGYGSTVSSLRSFPTNSEASSFAAKSGGTGEDGGRGFQPGWAAQHVANSNALYPPSAVIGPLDQIYSADYTCSYSVYVKEPSEAASEYVKLSIYRLVDDEGTAVDVAYAGVWQWSSGSLSLVSSDTGVTASTTSIGGGWYRIGLAYANTTAGGEVGDYLQARAYSAGGLIGTVGVFSSVADGGKGVNFLVAGDPMDVSNAAWTQYNASTGDNEISNATDVLPPFYSSSTAGNYGHVVRLIKDEAIATGTTPPNIVQSVTLTTGSGVASWSGERICFTGYACVGATNGASDSALYIDVRLGSSVDGNNLLTGDGVRFTLNSSGGPATSWAAGPSAKFEASGTVSNLAISVAPVRQSSTANDADWVQIDGSFDYTPGAGTFTDISLGAWIDGGGTASGGEEVIEIWGFRLHGRSDAGDLVNPWYHRNLLWWGAQYEPGGSSIAAFASGATIKLDRDVSLEAGKSYEVLLRSSFESDAGNVIDNLEVVSVSGSEVPTSGTTTISANTAISISAPTKFTAREGDLYSFGEVGSASADFVVTRISLDPTSMHRTVEAEEYNEAIYTDTAFGTLGDTTVSDLPKPQAQANLAAEWGIGYGDGGSLGRGSSFEFLVKPETISDRAGGGKTRLTFSWRWPRGMRKPKELRLWAGETRAGAAQPELRLVGVCSAGQGRYTAVLEDLRPGQSYTGYLQPVGWRGTASPPRACPSSIFRTRSMPDGSQIQAPVITTKTRGWEQIYQLEKPTGSRGYDVVEGRIGGWIMGTPAWVIDPDSGDLTSSTTVVGQASTPTGEVGMSVIARKRLSSGYYGPAATVTGDEQIVDLDYADSIACENDYSSNGVYSTSLALSSSVISFDAASSELTGTYEPGVILLSEARRVLVNCPVEAYQVRPETLDDCTWTIGSDTARRWSLEGPMDGFDSDNCSVLVEWKWTSAASFTTETFRRFRPGIVYARRIQYRITFTRPTADYNIRVLRVLSQALQLPGYSSDEITNASGVTGSTVTDALDQLDSDLAAVYSPSYMGRQNNSIQNLNGANVAANWNTLVASAGSDVTYDVANPSRIELNTTGKYRISVNLKGVTTTTQRANITAQIRQNGTAMRGPKTACGYIRYASSHDESSVHLASFVYPFTAGDYIEVVCNQEAAAGVWNSQSGLCSILVEYIGA